MYNVGLNLFWLTKTISRCWARNFFTIPKMGEGGIHLSHPNDCTKQERSALWSFPNFLRDLTMCFGSGRAKTIFAHGLKHLFLAEAEMLWHSAAAWERNKLHLKAAFFYAAFTHPFQTMRVCQLLCAYICNFLASTWVCTLWHVSYMLLPDADWGHSFPTEDLCCSRRAECLPAPAVLAPEKADG